VSDKRKRERSSTCVSCESDLVYPTDSCQIGSALWEVDLRCPECGWQGAARYNEAQLEELDRELDRAASVIEHQLGHLEAVHMEEWATQFTRALELDLIGPDDF
jgi:hypothetical protein